MIYTQNIKYKFLDRKGRLNVMLYDDNFYKQIVEALPIGYSYNKIICDKEENPYDFEFLEVNTAFEKLTGLKKSEIVGKRATQVISNLGKMEVDWIELYGDVAINQVEKNFKQYFESSKRWYKVSVYSPKKYYFITHISEITTEMVQLSDMEKLIDISEELLHVNKENFTYQKISDDFLKISGAKYAAFNLFNEDGDNFTTVAITGDKGVASKVSKIFGFEIEKKKWEYNLELEEKMKGKTIIRFNSLVNLAEGNIPIPLILLVEKLLKIGEIVLIKITRNNIMLGHFVLLMEKGKRFEKDTLAEVYSRQLSMFITRKKAEDNLLKEKVLTDAIFHSIPGMIYLYDDKKRLVRWNKKHEEITGYSSEELSKMTILDWFKDDKKSLKDVNDCMVKTIQEGFGDAEAELQKKDGTKVPMYFTASSVYLDNRQYLVGIAIDIAERKKREEEIFYLSYHDQLTGLFNRRFYEEQLKILDSEKNLPLSLIMGDVNGLKLINDSFGHIMGDELINKVAAILKSSCRVNDIICRLAGDEFVIILPKTSASEAEHIIKRIKHRALQEKIGSIDISISFGYETKNRMEEEIEDIYKDAEDYMYKKKLFEGPSMRGKAIQAIINTLYEKNKKEEEHSSRISELCKKMATALEMSENESDELISVAVLHDIGKIAVDEKILNKNGKLTEDEWKEVKRHPEVGYRMLNTVSDMSEIANYVLYHHERWDGKGYPKGLKGEEIPFISRIISIIDSYVVMTSERIYKRVLSKEEAIEELQEKATTQFDPELVKVFIEKVLK